MGEDNSKGQISNFNEASLKMIRIHESQRLINRLRVNMLAMDGDTRMYHYQILIAELLSLLSEVRPKMNTKEKEKASEWRDKITNLLETLPIVKQYWKDNHRGKQLMSRIDNTSWLTLRKEIFGLEDFVREQIEVHGLSSPNQEMEALWE